MDIPKRTALALALAIALAGPSVAHAQTPTDTPTLRQSVHELVANHTRIPYEPRVGPDAREVLYEADADPRHPGNVGRVIGLYDNKSWPITEYGENERWNIEHVWPREYGIGEPDTKCNYPANDLHHLFAVSASYNSSRSDLPFDWCPVGECAPKYVLEPTGWTKWANWMRGGDNGKWQVWGGRRGDVARALFYMDVRYEGGVNAAGCPEPDLVLRDEHAENDLPFMSKLTTLVHWHCTDPVSAQERQHNEVVAKYQGKGNPFVVYSPRLVEALYGPCPVWLPWTGR